MDIQTFTTTQLSLLATELTAETASQTALTATPSPSALQRAGHALTNLLLTSQRTGLGGKTVVVLEPDPATASAASDGGAPRLPQHGLRAGDVVSVMELGSGTVRKGEVERRGVAGVVLRVREGSVAVALDRDEGEVSAAARLWMWVCRRVFCVFSPSVAVLLLMLLCTVVSSWRMKSRIRGTLSICGAGYEARRQECF
jgi:DNA polymerase alpha-associated DNA helicase A